MSYPASTYSYTTLVDAVDYPLAAHVNTPNAELVLIETTLGTNPQGSAADVKTRMAVSLANDGDLRLTGSSTLTISSGAITATNNLHKVDTEAGAASDTLDTVSGGADGFVLLLSLANSSRIVTVGNNTGNVLCMGGKNITLAADGDFAVLVYSSALSKWRAMATVKTYTAVTSKTANYTATLADEVIECDATGGAFTITLPAAANSTGLKLYIKKTDASANTVTIDGNASETIDGATTKALASQYASYTIICNGSGWSIY